MSKAVSSFSLRVLFETVQSFLVVNQRQLTGVETRKELREGQSDVLKADLLAEQRLVPTLCKLWPGTPVLCEEAENSDLSRSVPGIQLLPYHDDVVDLPDTHMSVDGLDGSALYANGELSLVAMSAGLIKGGRPVAGVVMMLDSAQLFYNGLGGKDGVFVDHSPLSNKLRHRLPLKECLIGLDDNKAVSEDFRRLVISKLMGSPGTRYPINVPSVAGAMKVLRGNLAAYVTSNARHWDIAATAALCEADGLVARCLDGSPIPWACVRMPPVVFARDEEAFAYVFEQAQDYITSHMNG